MKLGRRHGIRSGAQVRAQNSADHDDGNLRKGGWPEQNGDGREDGQRASLPIGREGTRHAQNGLRHDRDGDQKKSVKPAGLRHRSTSNRVRKSDERNGGWQRKAYPGRHATP